MLKIHEGDILISRSGTIGKVTYATKDLAENYIVSDDLVRIRVKDANLRAYLLAYFTSSTALALMLLDRIRFCSATLATSTHSRNVNSCSG